MARAAGNKPPKRNVSKPKRRKLAPTKAKKNQRTSKKEATLPPDTFQRWIENQTKRKGEDRNIPEAKPWKMPPDSMNEWLAKQRVTEVESTVQIVQLPLGSTELWLQNQVSARVTSERANGETSSDVESSVATQSSTQTAP